VPENGITRAGKGGIGGGAQAGEDHDAMAAASAAEVSLRTRRL
jgi:hypothetical protein